MPTLQRLHNADEHLRDGGDHRRMAWMRAGVLVGDRKQDLGL
jgi:hypothetical protein